MEIRKKLNNSCFFPYLQKLRRLDYIIYYKYFCQKKKPEEKTVLMASDSRESLGSNLEFLDVELKKRNYKVVYFLKKSLKEKKTKKYRKCTNKQHFSIY